jgi:hypothetical protein
MIVPNPLIIFIPVMGTGWLRGHKQMKKLPQNLRNPKRPIQPIPTFDRKALRERVERLLRQTQHQREGLRAAAYG